MSDFIERPLGADLRREINELAAAARDLLGLGATGGSPKDVVAAINQSLATSGWLAHTGLEADEAAIALGSLWGEQCIRAFKWEWVALTEPDADDEDDAHVAVVPSDRRFVIFPTYFIRTLLEPGADVTALLIFNMIAAGNTPHAEAGAYLELGAPSDDGEPAPLPRNRPGMSDPIEADAVYRLHPTADGEWIAPENGDYNTPLYRCDGSSLADGWTAIPVESMSPHESGASRPSVFPWCGSHVVVMRQGALDVLRPMIERYGEILPLASGGEPLSMLNVTTVVDGLDQERSEIVRFADGDIMDIPRHAFHADVIRGIDVFKLSGLRASSVYVTGRVIQAALDGGLDGFAWEKLWSPDRG